MKDEQLQDAIQSVINKTKEIAHVEQNVRVLKFVKALHEQGRISDEVAHTFFLEFTLDM